MATVYYNIKNIKCTMDAHIQYKDQDGMNTNKYII